jgi:hypothetical protein
LTSVCTKARTRRYRVVAVEADPDLAAACRHRFRPEIDRGALHIIEGVIVAVNDRKDRYIKFYKNPQESLWGSTDAIWRDRNARLGAPSTEIEVPRLDFRRHPAPLRHAVLHEDRSRRR